MDLAAIINAEIVHLFVVVSEYFSLQSFKLLSREFFNSHYFGSPIMSILGKRKSRRDFDMDFDDDGDTNSAGNELLDPPPMKRQCQFRSFSHVSNLSTTNKNQNSNNDDVKQMEFNLALQRSKGTNSTNTTTTNGGNNNNFNVNFFSNMWMTNNNSNNHNNSNNPTFSFSFNNWSNNGNCKHENMQQNNNFKNSNNCNNINNSNGKSDSNRGIGIGGRKELSPATRLKYISEKIPLFKTIGVLNGKFVSVTNNYLTNNNQKWCILYFYRCDFVVNTRNELEELNFNLNYFSQLNCNVVGISTDSQYAHDAWIKTFANYDKFNIMLLSDLRRNICTNFDVLLNGKYDNPYNNGGQSIKCLFIIDNNQIVKFFTKLENDNMDCQTFVKNLLQTIKNLQSKKQNKN